MRQSVAILIASVAVAQSATIDYFFPGGYEGYEPIASIVKVDGPTVVAQLTCPTTLPDYDDTECGWGPGLELTVISSATFVGTMKAPQVTMTYSCEGKKNEKSMTCDASIGGAGANSPMSENAVLSGTDAQTATAQVTAGWDKLSATTGAASSSVKTSASPAPTTGPAATASQASATAGSSTVASAQTTETGAAYQLGVKGSALFALAGAAALNAW
ncbi:hypothetical protein BU24DRAFT_216402 [Aaosphaeria arxii CBS 175.79]|uniref:GPI anchored protein n=1 Tax=Aaosphaeria arxii CBS 175.79 TaxID=1450172 RepID=A0A6A5XNR2_9PLEO|nr:uncharacterized protein BU24DRAFT_216402 [Aaosphaeria arxii CBS 175.79]KAF2014546.1 hypothetical protein BU24DRAFT_216402 [Aaosphaeria arxii CBS 175.79]